MAAAALNVREQRSAAGKGDRCSTGAGTTPAEQLNRAKIYEKQLKKHFKTLFQHVIIIGEFHTDPVAHLIEYNFLKEAINAHLSNSNNKYSAREEDKRRGKVILSLEMLERDIQVRKVTQKMLFSICVKDRIQISSIFKDAII